MMRWSLFVGVGEARVKFLVSGGAGFIGHHLVRRLVERGDEVTVIDDFSTGRRSRLEAWAGRVRLVEGSILDPRALDSAVDGCEVILHHAAIASVVRSLEEPRLTNDVNVSGTIEVMLAAARHEVRRVILAGSSAVYGIPASLPSREDASLVPQSPYGASKLAAEHYLHTLGEYHGVETVVLRYFNVFGPGQDPASEYAAVVPKFITAVLDGRHPTINGNGEITRDFLYVDDVVDANLLASVPSAPNRLTCNIAGGSRISLLDLLGAVCAAAGGEIAPLYGPARSGDIEHSQADISTAQRALGFGITTPFAEGIARTVQWYRDCLPD
jgi:UDP-glucose 4-epimerase